VPDFELRRHDISNINLKKQEKRVGKALQLVKRAEYPI
jgi:hypothetical protein